MRNPSVGPTCGTSRDRHRARRRCRTRRRSTSWKRNVPGELRDADREQRRADHRLEHLGDASGRRPAPARRCRARRPACSIGVKNGRPCVWSQCRWVSRQAAAERAVVRLGGAEVAQPGAEVEHDRLLTGDVDARRTTCCRRTAVMSSPWHGVEPRTPWNVTCIARVIPRWRHTHRPCRAPAGKRRVRDVCRSDRPTCWLRLRP